MNATIQELLDYILSLLGNPTAAAAFQKDPEAALAKAGFGDLCSADIDAVIPVIRDYAPVNVAASSFDRGYDTGSGPVTVKTDDHRWDSGDHHDDHRDDDHSHAVQQLHTIVNNYSYTTTNVDDRDTIADFSVNQNIWTEGDFSQSFDNHVQIVSGDHSVAASGAAVVDQSTTDNSDNSINGSYNDSSNHSVNGSFNDNSDHSDNSDNSVNGSFNDNSTSTDVDVDVEIRDSFQDNADNSITTNNTTTTNNTANVNVEDSFQDNSDNSVVNDSSTNVDVDVEDSFQDNSDNSTNNTADVQIEDSFRYEPETSSYTDNSDNSDHSVNVSDINVEDVDF